MRRSVLLIGVWSLAAALLGGCTTARAGQFQPFGGTCALPTRPGVKEYLCKHCNCIMQVADDEWDQPCAACNCHRTNKECL